MGPADRYVRLGGRLPQIYPGTLAELSNAIRDTRRDSESVPGRHLLEAVHAAGRRTVQVWEDGVRTWWAADPERQQE